MDLQKDITQTDKSKVELLIQFLLHWAETNKISPQIFKVKKNNCCTWVGINSVMKFTFRDSDRITCRWVKIIKSPTKHIELLFSKKSSTDTTFHFRKGPSIKALTFVADGSTSLWRCRAELKWLFWGVPSWQWMKKGEEEQRKGGQWIVEGMEWRMLEKGEGEYLTELY